MILYLFVIYLVFILAFCWLGSLLIFCVAKARQKPETVRANRKMLSWSSGLVFLTGAAIWFLFFLPAPLVYRIEFGEFPGSDVTNSQSYSFVGHDGETKLLRFQAAPATVERLAQIQKLPVTSLDQLHNYSFSRWDRADWGEPNVTTNSRFYAIERKEDSYLQMIALIYDPQTQIAYYSFNSIKGAVPTETQTQQLLK